MGILIKGITAGELLRVFELARIGANNCMIGHGVVATELPDHGDLIDRDALFDDNSWDWFNEWGSTVNKQAQLVADAPAVIPAERSKG